MIVLSMPSALWSQTSNSNWGSYWRDGSGDGNGDGVDNNERNLANKMNDDILTISMT